MTVRFAFALAVFTGLPKSLSRFDGYRSGWLSLPPTAELFSIDD